jgi:hypothetical protein
VAAALLGSLLGPGPAGAQGWREAQVWAVGTASDPAFGGVGFGLSWRDRGRSRGGVAVAGGVQDRGAAGRVELVYHFLLDPARQRGDGAYGGGGVTVSAGPDGRLRPYLQLVIGAENGPASPRGTFIEVGVGGGVRVAVGLRWRKRNAPRN